MRTFVAMLLASSTVLAQEPAAPPAASPMRFALGARLEPFMPVGSPLGPAIGFALSGNYQVTPLGPGSLFLGGSVGFVGGLSADKAYSISAPPLSLAYAVSLSRTAVPLLAEASFSLPLGTVFGFARLGVGAAFVSETVTVTYDPSQIEQVTHEAGWGFAWSLAAGAAFPMGPGAASLALRFAHADPGLRAVGGSNLLGGMGIELGYRLPLF